MKIFKLFLFLSSLVLLFVVTINVQNVYGHGTEKHDAEIPSTKPSASKGKVIYDEHCLKCHGETGSGEGEDPENVKKDQKDFNDQTFMRKEKHAIFFTNLKDGREPMPAFKDTLTDQEIWDVIAYVWTFQNEDDLLAQGKEVYDDMCVSCHGENGDGNGPKADELETKPIDFADIDHAATWNSNIAFENITEGMKDEGMPAYKKKLSEGERWNVINYIWTGFVHQD